MSPPAYELAYSRMTQRVYITPKRRRRDGSVMWSVDVTDQFWDMVKALTEAKAEAESGGLKNNEI